MEWLSTWWGGLDIFSQILHCISIPSTLILIIQTILIIAGFGDSGPDTNLSDTSGLDLPDGGVDFDGGTDLSGIDGDVSGHDVGNPADASAMHLFTFQGIITFLCVFAWSAILTYMGTNSILLSLLVGFVLGAGAMFGVAKIIQASAKLAQNGNINAKNYLGELGTVYLVIPAAEKGRGKVNISLGERYVEFDAITEDADDIPSGTSVRVVDVRSESLLVVERA
mgnify:FL=1